MSFISKNMPFVSKKGNSKKNSVPEVPSFQQNGHPVKNSPPNISKNNNNYNNNNSENNAKNNSANNNSGQTDEPKTGQQQLTKLSFQCQLAEGSRTTFVSGFSNMKQFFDKLANNYAIPVDEILYCTLNTPKVDMDHLLGAQIGLDDLIFIHRKGQRKEVEITKTEEYLGLTITDNGNGYAFIKKIREGSPADQIKFIEAGDHIEKINNESMVGCRHYEVAKALKEIPIGDTFTIRLIEPFKEGLHNIGPRTDNSSSKRSPTIALGTGHQTLRFRKRGPPTVEDVPSDAMLLGIDRINSLLESYMGINDNEMAAQIWELGKDKSNPSEFVITIDSSDLQEFSFSDDFVFDLWGAINDAKTGRLNKMQN